MHKWEPYDISMSHGPEDYITKNLLISHIFFHLKRSNQSRSIIVHSINYKRVKKIRAREFFQENSLFMYLKFINSDKLGITSHTQVMVLLITKKMPKTLLILIDLSFLWWWERNLLEMLEDQKYYHNLTTQKYHGLCKIFKRLFFFCVRHLL